MIKKILFAILLAMPMCAMAQTAKFGTVDPDAIVPAMTEFQEVQKALGEKSKSLETEYNKLQEEIKGKYEEYQKVLADESTLQPIKDRRLQDIQDATQKAEQFAANAQQAIAMEQQRLMAPVQEKVINAIQAVGKEGNFTMIFPTGAAVYTATEVVDVTPLVKAKLGIKDTPAN